MVNNGNLTVKLLLLTTLFVNVSFCCKDWKIKSKKIGNCQNSNNRIKIVNASLYFDDKCDLMMTSCADIQPYSTSLVTTRKNGIIIFDQKIDLCNKKQHRSEPIQMVLDILGLNSEFECLMKSPAVLCQTNKRVLRYTKSLQMMFKMLEDGKISYSKILFTHDTGKSCFDVEHAIVPN